jgi:phosphotriesterase-related protein
LLLFLDKIIDWYAEYFFMVNSVLGSINPSNLGFTLMHEHIIAMNSSMYQAFSEWFNRKDTISNAVKELQYSKQYGLHTIVDATPINLGRDIKLLREVGKKIRYQHNSLYWVPIC